MSLEKLLTNIHEYSDLLEFLKDNYPEILAKWAQAQQAHQDADTNSFPDQEVTHDIN